MQPFPQVVRIEPAGRCNFKCRHCPIKNLRGLLSLDDFRRIFDSLPFVPRVLVLYHGGESLLNKELEQMIAYAKEKGVKWTVLNTNASLIRALSGLDEMRVSFDGDSAEENNFIRVGGNFAKHAPKVKALAQAGQRITIYNARVSSGEAMEPAKYLTDYFGDLVKYRTEPMRLWASQDKALEGHEFIEKPTGAIFCSNLMETFTVLANGDVPKCCEDLNGEDIYGNVFTESPQRIWENMQNIRYGFTKQIYPEQCKTCWVVAGRYVK